MSYTNINMRFDRKGYGRFFVEKEEDIVKVEAIMREIDEYEFDNYYPKSRNLEDQIITVFKPENYKSVYLGKFDEMDMGLVMKKAWEQGVKCFCVFGKCNELDDF